MNIVGIDIQLWQEQSFIDIVAILQNYGWQFYGGNIVYLPPLNEGESEEDWNWKVDSKERWLEIKQEIKLKQFLGETVGIKLEWIEDKCFMAAILNANHRLSYSLFVGYPQLPDSKIPDFTWMLTHTVSPLEKSKYDIREIECWQDRS